MADINIADLMHPRPWETADFDRGPSPHLSWLELGCKDGTPYPEKWRRSRGVVLAREFEVVRFMAGGKPIPLGSAFRTKTWNKKVGGSRKSQHVEARALDNTPKHLSIPAFLDIVIERARMQGSRIRGIGLYRTFVHWDIRPGDRIARWRGSRVSPEVLKEAFE